MRYAKASVCLLVLTCLVGCATVYSGVVTLTSVVDSAMKAWADLSVKGATTPAIDARVVTAHNQYRQAAAVAESALLAYKANGDPGSYTSALAAAKTAASGLVDIIVPLLLPQQANTLKSNLSKASTL